MRPYKPVAFAENALVWFDRAGLRRALDYKTAVEALHAAFARPSAAYGNPERDTHAVPDGELMLMPASGAEGVGVKLVTLTPANPPLGLPFIQGVYALFAAGHQTPEAIFDGAALTELRTAAVSALATSLLAPEDCRHLVVFGAGVQAAAHVEAMRVVRPSLEHVTIVGRDPARAAALVAVVGESGLPAAVGSADAVRSAELVCTCTTTLDPLFAAELVQPGTHVNAVGAYRTDRRELEPALLARATVIVEEREAALAEAGDIVLAMADGALDGDGISGDLHDVASGRIGRPGPDAVTVFKSVGLAFEDLVVARAALAA
jgi:ornithine cyclodeaminase/alanine dehydrogenase-like protein (mu-crystallin family)